MTQTPATCPAIPAFLDRTVETIEAGADTAAKLVVHGLPITGKTAGGVDPWRAVAGGSFLISYYHRRKGDLERVTAALGDDQILLLDNGAFSAWRNGLELDDDYWQGFETWAAEILARVPQAVAIVPDVIGGSVDDNLRLIRECTLPIERTMVVWHLNEPLELLRYHIESGRYFIGIGSAGEFAQVGTAAWTARMTEAFDYLDALFADADFASCYARPWLHMLRGIGVQGAWRFDSADSTNFAVNYKRQDKRGEAPAQFAARIEGGARRGSGHRSVDERPTAIAADQAALAELMREIWRESIDAGELALAA
ncbi:MAG: hypothetical protein VW338_15855 [Rhodospirillaceae bacterium]